MMARYIHGTRFSINNELSSSLILKHCCRDKNDRNDIRVWTSCTEYRGQLWVSKDKEIQRVQKIGQKRKKSMALTNVFVIPRMNDIWNHSFFIFWYIFVSTIQSWYYYYFCNRINQMQDFIPSLRIMQYHLWALYQYTLFV